MIEPAQTGSVGRTAILLAALLGLVGPSVACGADDDSAAPAGVARTAEDARPLAVGSRMPELELADASGRPVALGALADQGVIALVFYRGGW